MVFSLFFANNTIILCFFSLFLIIDLYPLILSAITTNKAKQELKTQLVRAETKVSDSCNLK